MLNLTNPYVLRRAVFVAFLAAVVVVVGWASYFLLSSYEARIGTVRYNSIATFAIDSLSNNLNDQLNSVLTLAKAVQYGVTNSTAWPNVYLPGFFDTVASQRDATGLDDMFLASLVTPEQLPSYKDFLRKYIAEEPAIPDSAGFPAYTVFGIDFNTQPMQYEEFTGETRSYVSPHFYITPVTQFLYDRRFTARNFGLNMHSLPQYGRSIDAIIACCNQHNYSEAIHLCPNISTVILLPLGASITDVQSFHSKLIQPVFLNFNSSQLVGFVGGGFDWRTFLSPTFGTAREDIDVVVQNGDIVFTYTTTKQGIRLKGYGDLHESDYNQDHHETTLFASFDGTHNAAMYKISIYPTREYYRSYSTSAPIVTATGVGFLMLVCAAAFLLYDQYMHKLNEAGAVVLETKRRFVRFISHEIRTPLNALHLGLEALAAEVGRTADLLRACLTDPALDPPHMIELLQGWQELSAEMMVNSDCAVDVLNDLLNYDKIEMGTLRLEFSAVPIWEVVRTATIGFLTPAKNKKIHLSLESDLERDAGGVEERSNSQFAVIGDHARLAQVMRNLISNAIKFTPESGSIAIRLERVGNTLNNPPLLLPQESVHLLKMPRAGSIRISVTDSGVGLTVVQLAQICSEGVQFNANELQAGKGSGLGLFITKGIVELHCGTLSVASAGLKAGTVFTLELPLFVRIPLLALTDLRHCTVAPEPFIPIVRSVSAPALSHFNHPLVSSRAADLEDTVSQKRILVVDDAASNRKMLIRILKSSGYVCEQAEDGQQAIDRYVESIDSGESFHFIIMDFEMPVMNGPTATGHLRAMGCTVPILGVTGNLLPDDVMYFKAQGANQVFGKPLNLAHFEMFMRDQEKHRQHSLNCTPVPTHGSFMADVSQDYDVV